MTITIKFDDSIKDRVFTAMAAKHGYQAQVSDGKGGVMDNPVPIEIFTANILGGILKDCVVGFEGEQAHDAAIVKSNQDILISG